jgi:hypothetical protein
MNSLETYLKELSEIRSFGAAVKEISYYGLLANLLNEVGKTLKELPAKLHLQRCVKNPGSPVSAFGDASRHPGRRLNYYPRFSDYIVARR